MKTTATVDTHACDFCGQIETYQSQCRLCKKDICFGCRKTHSVEYPHAVHFAGTGDGTYCKSCDEKLRQEGNDPLHAAYLGIQAMRDEMESFQRQFRDRAAAAEEAVQHALASREPVHP